MEKLVKCKVCGNKIAKSAKICPYCGVKSRRISPIFALFVFFLGCVMIGLMGKNLGDKSEKKEKQGKEATPVEEETSVPVVFDALQYRFLDSTSGLYLTSNEQEIIAALGEPEDIDVWNYERNGLLYEIRSLSYNEGKYVYEFNNNYLHRIQIFENFSFDDKDDILPMFGLEMLPKSKAVDTGATYRVYDCGINDLWCTFGSEEGIIDMTYISYTDIFS